MSENDLLNTVLSTQLLHPLALEAFGLKIDAIADAVGVEVETLRNYRAGKGSSRRRQPGKSTRMLAAKKAQELAKPGALKYPHYLAQYITQ